MMSGEAISAQMAICVRSSSFVTQSAPVCHNHSPTTTGSENQAIAHRHCIPCHTDQEHVHVVPVAGSSIRCEDSAPVACTLAGFIAAAEWVLMTRGGGTTGGRWSKETPFIRGPTQRRTAMLHVAGCIGGAQASRSRRSDVQRAGYPSGR